MTSNTASTFQAPHPGSQAMPRWNVAELIDAPRFTGRNWFAMLGPGLMMAGSAIGGGEWLTGPLVTARYGGTLLWLASLSILGQVIYNVEISRYTLYTGEPIFTGKFRTLPGPRFWLIVYLVLDIGSIFSYLAASAATPLATVFLGGRVPDIKTDFYLLKGLSCVIFLCAFIPLIFGGKVYNALKVVMTFKIFIVCGFLLLVAALYSGPQTWKEIFSGFVKFGNVPVLRGEDTNGNGQLDPGEDWDGDGKLDPVEEAFKPTIDTNDDGKPDAYADIDGDGKPDKFRDLDRDGIRDGRNVENMFVSMFEGRGFPTIDFGMIGLLCAMVAISGNGGLTNTSTSGYTRDQGWGMGHHVGAIPSVVGGHKLQLSHVGSVFQVTPESLTRWRRWVRHVLRDQWVVWMPGCFIGLALPSMLSVEFLPRGIEAENWTAAAMTASYVGERAATDTTAMISGPMAGQFFWFMTMFCGFLVLAPSVTSTSDGVIRRWVDVFWTSSATLQKIDPKHIGRLYFGVLCMYGVFGIVVLLFIPGGNLILIATNIYNFALGFSCFHTLVINCVLLPRELRPSWFLRIGLMLSGTFFMLIAGLTIYTTLRDFGWI